MENTKYNALFVISSSFPYGEAFSSRARNMIKLFNECGYKVFVIAPDTQKSTDCIELESFDYETHYVHDPKNFLSLSGIGTAKPYIKAIEKLSKYVKFNLIVSSAMVHVTNYLYKWSRENHVPYIMEQCEWYDDSTFKGGKLNPYYREHIRLIEKKNKRVDGIIAISSLFQKHYNSQHVPTLRMPTILNVSEIKYRTSVDSKNFIRIVFAGSLGKGKEKFADIIKALKIINAENVKIKLDIYGATRKQLLENLENESNILTNTEDFINIFGRIPQEQVEDKLRNADFSIFSRPIRRSSNAGFPTKLAESMSVGTPVITNNTGDISLYLHNGNNGFIANENSIEALLDIFNRIVNMNSDDLTKMRKQARHTAESSFSYEKYKNGLLELIREAEERII